MEGEQEAKRAKKEAPSAVPEDAVIHVNGVSTAEKQQYLAAADAADTVQDPFVDAADVKPPVEPSAVVDGIIEEAVLAQSEVDAMDVDGVGNARVDPEVVGVVAPVEEAMDLDEIPQQDGVELAPLVGSVEETPQQIAHEALIAVTPKKSAPPIPTSPLSEMVAPSSPTVATPPRSRSRRASSTKGDIQVKRETPGGDSMEPEEEDASMKLAKLLQGEEFGLRRRSR